MGFLFFKNHEPREATFHMPYHFDNEVNDKVIFDEAYFQNNEEYSLGLAKLSLAFAISSFSSNLARNDLSKSANNGIEFLSSCGFKKIRPNEDYSLPPTPFSLGAIFGKKKIKINKKRVTLIAVGIRGGNYGAEWASNVTVGESGPHEGFALSKEKLYQDFISYLTSNRIRGRVAVWTTGFSRAGGVANLFAGDLLEESEAEDLRIKNARISKDNIFAYCFASPATGMENEEDFAGIFHTLNPNDAVPLVPPSSFGFRHYGKVTLLPDFYEEDINKSVRERLSSIGVTLPNKEFFMMKFDLLHMKDKEKRCVVDTKQVLVSQGQFLQEFFTALVSGMDRKGYYLNAQEGLAALLAMVDSSLPDPYIHIKNVFLGIFAPMFEEHNGISLLTKLLSKKFDMASFITPYVDMAIKGEGLENVDDTSIARSLAFIVKSSLPYIEKKRGLVATMVNADNSSMILLAHQPYLYWALLNQI